MWIFKVIVFLNLELSSKNISDEALEIVKKMLEKDFLRRISASEALNSVWFSEECVESKKT